VVNAIPVPLLSSLTNLTICPNDLQKGYFAQSSPGFSNSTFSWTLGGGAASTPTNQAFLGVNWNNAGPYSLVLRETTTAGCIKDTLVPLVYDPSLPFLTNVSLLENDETQVALKFSMANPENNPSTFGIERKELNTPESSWAAIQTGIPLNINGYTDQPGNTTEKAYQYRIVSQNLCAKRIESQVHNTILLNVIANQEQEGAGLSWNPYVNWPAGVSGYSVLRQVDQESSLRSFDEIGSTAGLTKFYEVAGDGFNQCWRLVAKQNEGNEVSFSNKVCVKFDNPLIFYNLITPNGDDKNDTWAIKNLKLYPENELTIVDRWGKTVYKKSNYNDADLWDGGNLNDGVVFYKFTVPSRGIDKNGWITIKR
jgi:gliding motility-associated-like protein